MLNEAIRLFTGYGSAVLPRADAGRVRSNMPAADAEAALKRIEGLLAEIHALQPDWKAQTLADASQWAEAEMRRRHPDLSDASLSALAWCFSYFWK